MGNWLGWDWSLGDFLINYARHTVAFTVFWFFTVALGSEDSKTGQTITKTKALMLSVLIAVIWPALTAMKIHYHLTKGALR